ncbi:MAG: DUF3368 domain-containing protein [Thermoanaerobaculia bacterium]|nr:DUF3368 domain-containing protein [Thermoanaerobaculia bacterium]
MNAVFDASPLCYLVLIDEIDVAARLFDGIYVPRAVVAELSHPGAPSAVREWIRHTPPWVKIHRVPSVSSPSLQSLHAGGREAILLARALDADEVVIDEKAARKAAQALALRVTGLVGLLGRAAELKLIDLPRAIGRLEKTGFHVAPSLLKNLLDQSRQ